MIPYNVEIFDKGLSLKSHYSVNELEYKYDYLDPEKSNVMLPDTVACETDDYIWITKGSMKIFGIVTALSDKENHQREVTYTDFAQVLDVDIEVDTAEFGTVPLTEYIAEQIRKTFITNADLSQRIQCLATEAEQEITDWTLPIEPESEEETRAIANLFDDIILPAFTNYEVLVKAEPDIMSKTITAHVYINPAQRIVIEAGLSNIIAKEITIRKAKKETNKLIVINKKDYGTQSIYFLHPDGTFDKTDADRMTPVKYKIATVSTKTNSEFEEAKEKEYTNAVKKITRIQKKTSDLDDKDRESVATAVETLNTIPGISLVIGTDGKVTSWDEETANTAITTYTGSYQFETFCRGLADDAFEAKASEKAAQTFRANAYESLIELEMVNEDTMIHPEDLEAGQRVGVIHEGEIYETILTGKTIAETTLLTFGNVRLELTKILKGRGQ